MGTVMKNIVVVIPTTEPTVEATDTSFESVNAPLLRLVGIGRLENGLLVERENGRLLVAVSGLGRPLAVGGDANMSGSTGQVRPGKSDGTVIVSNMWNFCVNLPLGVGDCEEEHPK